MNRKAALVPLVIVSALLLNAAGATALPSVPHRTAGAMAAFAHFFLALKPITWWDSHTLVDAAGGVHTAFYDTENVTYGYCAADCGDPENWTRTALDDAGSYDSLNHPVLALDPNGHPRMLRFKSPSYIYAECNSNCTQAGQWTSVAVPLADEPNTMYPSNVRYFALDTQGRPHFVATHYYGGFVYATCDANCTVADNWQDAWIELGTSLDGLQIVLDPNDRPRVVGINDDEQLDYVECNSDCLQTAGWTRVTLVEGAGRPMYDDPTYSLRLDAQGRPRIAFYLADDQDPNLTYAWSNADFTSAASWSSYTVNLPPADKRAVDLALGADGRPRVAFASSESNLDYAECTADCESSGAAWQVQHVETAAELNASDPVPPDPGCVGSSWFVGDNASLALDADGNPSLSYYARSAQLCNGRTENNAWAIRFATAGGTAPQDGRHVYLPVVER